MTRGTIIVAVAALVLTGMLVWSRYSWATYRYLLTVAVDTPSGLRTASVVHEVRARRALLSLPDSATASVEFKGEALRVDLGDGKALFVLVQPAERTEETLVPIINAALDPEYTRGGIGNLNSIRRIARGRARSEATLPTSTSKLRFVRFRDDGQPATVEAVSPDAFESAFGEGYRLREIRVETTNRPVTDKIRAQLPWLEPEGRPLEGTLSGIPPLGVIDPEKTGDVLGYRSFVREYR
ncbi:hypothetical protein [Sphingomicrobium aestuariivivum]|uniref:hypothetical protein n=1 Tax=Sphingomicrobium aestuariivivum TaxID=1582356 RepID=UPI001FD650F6|nr:hypothetical protein [Sphingomicrobium aestuariivivum]MCJ8190235.1 hypothetical protein [Sphingomicrobium aestuariivivum]